MLRLLVGEAVDTEFFTHVRALVKIHQASLYFVMRKLSV